MLSPLFKDACFITSPMAAICHSIRTPEQSLYPLHILSQRCGELQRCFNRMYVFIKLIALISKLKFLLQAETFFFLMMISGAELRQKCHHWALPDLSNSSYFKLKHVLNLQRRCIWIYECCIYVNRYRYVYMCLSWLHIIFFKILSVMFWISTSEEKKLFKTSTVVMEREWASYKLYSNCLNKSEILGVFNS